MSIKTLQAVVINYVNVAPSTQVVLEKQQQPSGPELRSNGFGVLGGSSGWRATQYTAFAIETFSHCIHNQPESSDHYLFSKNRSRDRSVSRSPIRRRERERRSRSIEDYMCDMAKCMERSIESMSRSSQQSQTREFRETKNPIVDSDPSHTTQNIFMWIQKIETFCKQYKWSDLTTSTHMMKRLKGNARRWFKSLPSIAFSWAEWKEKLTAAFTDEIEFPVRIEKALRRVKYPNETMSTYYFDKLAPLTPYGLDDYRPYKLAYSERV